MPSLVLQTQKFLLEPEARHRERCGNVPVLLAGGVLEEWTERPANMNFDVGPTGRLGERVKARRVRVTRQHVVEEVLEDESE